MNDQRDTADEATNPAMSLRIAPATDEAGRQEDTAPDATPAPVTTAPITTAPGQPIAAARLAYGRSLHDQPALAERKAMFMIAAGGLMLTTTGFSAAQLSSLARAG